jgi:hypothetical protein
LNEYLLTGGRLRYGGSWVYQQDNDPKHTAKVTKNWLEANVPGVLEWPSRSPDLNPIENIWSLMKRALRGPKFQSVQDLESAILKFWEDLSSETVRNCVMSMKKRCKLVQQAKGGSIAY